MGFQFRGSISRHHQRMTDESSHDFCIESAASRGWTTKLRFVPARCQILTVHRQDYARTPR
jgi:hypothetical protein